VNKDITRRNFLKLAVATGIAASLPFAGQLTFASNPTYPLPSPPSPVGYATNTFMARSIAAGVYVRASADRNAEVVGYLREDQVVLVTGKVTAEEPQHNPVWYRVQDGFVHSSWLQPVRIRYQKTPARFPKNSFLTEVSVPFVDARWEPWFGAGKAYRYYYGTTFWITSISEDDAGNVWYKVWDDRAAGYHYAPARAMRILPYQEFSPISPQVPPDQKRIHVDSQTNRISVYEYDQLVFELPICTGDWYKEGGEWKDYTTTPGTYRVLWKMPSRHMAGGDLASADGFDLPGVPWCTFFSSSGMAIHGTYWHNDFGVRRSHGCVNVPSEVAHWLYRWTTPYLSADVDYQPAKNKEGTLIEVI